MKLTYLLTFLLFTASSFFLLIYWIELAKYNVKITKCKQVEAKIASANIKGTLMQI